MAADTQQQQQDQDQQYAQLAQFSAVAEEMVEVLDLVDLFNNTQVEPDAWDRLEQSYLTEQDWLEHVEEIMDVAVYG
tara:strand:+ start:284 stop:514 length:231 start_codon:yes stop_codon:yes gene_type:complete